MRFTRKNYAHPFSFLRFAEKKNLEKIFKTKIAKFQKPKSAFSFPQLLHPDSLRPSPPAPELSTSN